MNEAPQSTLAYSAKIENLASSRLTGGSASSETSILSGGSDLRMSLSKASARVPGSSRIAVGGGVRTITGSPELQLTVAGLDVQISKPLPIADSSIVTPWVGYQYLWIFGDSGMADLTPGTDAVGYCGYSGPNVPGNGDSERPGVYDGQPVCHGGSSLDFNNNAVFAPARLERQRLLLGVNYRYEMLMVGGQFITDLINPADAQIDAADAAALDGEDRQWTIVLEAGAMLAYRLRSAFGHASRAPGSRADGCHRDRAAISNAAGPPRDTADHRGDECRASTRATRGWARRDRDDLRGERAPWPSRIIIRRMPSGNVRRSQAQPYNPKRRPRPRRGGAA